MDARVMPSAAAAWRQSQLPRAAPTAAAYAAAYTAAFLLLTAPPIALDTRGRFSPSKLVGWTSAAAGATYAFLR